MSQRFTFSILLCAMLFIGLFQGVGTNAATIADFIVPRGFTFNRDLVKGTTTIPDVMFLQNLLNISTSTRVSENDRGSNGKLTSYYGDRTERAVAKFQRVFRNDIEYEKSISTTTGALTYVLNPRVLDQYSRAVLNKLVLIYRRSHDQYLVDRGLASSTPAYYVYTEFDTGVDDTTGGSSDIEKTVFKYSPGGMLIWLIGGDKALDFVYSYTPSGQMSGGGAASSGGGAASSFSIGGIGGGSAGGGTAIQNFGGKTTSMVNCTCSFNILLYVQDVRGQTLPLMYQPGYTTLYMNYMPTSGVNVLGQYVSGGQCLIYAGTSCTSGGTPTGTMIQLGTSLTTGT